MRPKIFVSCICIFVLSLIFFNRFTETKINVKDGPSVYEYLSEKSLIRSDFTLFLRSLLLSIRPEESIFHEFNINKPYTPGWTNIYTIDPSGDKEISDIFTNNFYAIPPDVIVIDNLFLALLIVESYGYRMEHGSRHIEAITGDSIYATEMDKMEADRTYEAYGTYLSFMHIDQLFQRDSELTETARYLTENFILDPANYQTLFQMIYGYFIPIISHEFAHLSFDKNLKLTDSLVIYEERRADSISIIETIKYIEEYAYLNKDFTIPQIFAFSKLMRNLLLYETYDGLRGIDAVDHLIGLQDPDTLTEFESSLAPNDLYRLTRGYEKQPPALLKSERKLYENKLVKYGGIHLHDHMIKRMFEINQRISEKYNINDHSLNLYMSILYKKEYNRAFELADFHERKYDSFEFDLYEFQSNNTDLKFEQTRFRNQHKIETALFPNNSGYIELHHEFDERLYIERPLTGTIMDTIEFDDEIYVEEKPIFKSIDSSKELNLIRILFVPDRELSENYSTITKDNYLYNVLLDVLKDANKVSLVFTSMEIELRRNYNILPLLSFFSNDKFIAVWSPNQNGSLQIEIMSKWNYSYGKPYATEPDWNRSRILDLDTKKLLTSSAEPDDDEDGVPDKSDKYPLERGRIEDSGYPNLNEPKSNLVDSDKDGIPDHLDKCAYQYGLRVYDGCPDSDGDGIADFRDRCPQNPGLITNQGCPDG